MEEIRPTFGAVAKELQDFIYNEIDAITESDWFAEKLDNKVAIAIGEKETPLRVDVNYVVQRLEEIVNSDHTDAVEFLEELKENLDNHKGKKNGLDSIRKAN
jgi:hypothetical protein